MAIYALVPVKIDVFGVGDNVKSIVTAFDTNMNQFKIFFNQENDVKKIRTSISNKSFILIEANEKYSNLYFRSYSNVFQISDSAKSIFTEISTLYHKLNS
jgi:hypothetical protein